MATRTKPTTKAKKAPKKRAAAAQPEPLYWVAIGASAGGLEALRAFVRNVPNKLNATYIVVQHLSPHHRSMLPEIIGRETDFEVLSVENNVVPKANKIYITPQNKDIEIDGDRLRLTAPSSDAGTPKPSVDRLFRSLAVQKEKYAVGIILSGTGSDGSRGIRDVRAAGGITIAQDELSAKYSGMPVAAVESGCVDLVMSPEEIGAQFATILEKRADLESLKASPVHLDGVSELIHLVNTQTRVNFRHYKAATLQRRIERRMAAVGVTQIDDYVSIARTSPTEIDALFRDFLISVTSFFRDPTEFESLREYIKQIIANKSETDALRVWIPAAATGEEVYSLAMMIADILGGAHAFSKRRVQIFASDIDKDAIEIARRGFYPETSVEEVPRHYVEEYFDKVPTGYMVKKIIRERVVFSIHNLIQDPPFLNIDIISCRNLLIYFQNSLQAQALARFNYALVPNGMLFLGKSETVSANEALFRPADAERHIYFQRPTASKPLFNDFISTSYAQKPAPATQRATVDVRDVTTATSRFDSLVKSLGPDGFLIDQNMQILKAYGNINPYIEIPSGAISLSATTLLKEPFGQDIRTAVPIVLRKGEVRKCIARPDPFDPDRRVRVSVYPIDSGPNEPPLALALISSWAEDSFVPPSPQSDGGSDLHRQNDELRQELAISQANLQQTAEELETSNEELQALNEELQSSNEELQSTNEELETSNEELQSTNEELSTVNEELQVNSNELRVVNLSINSILLNIGSPLIVVDKGLNIIHVSHATEELFDINPENELPHLSLLRKQNGFPNIVDLADQSITKKVRIDTQVVTDDLNAIITIVPNLSENGLVVGAIILILDNTRELKRTSSELQLIFDNIPQGIFVRSPSGKVLKVNRAGAELTGRPVEELEGAHFSESLSEETAKRIAEQDAEMLRTGEPVLDQISEYEYADGTKRWVRVSRIVYRSSETDEPVLYSLAQDVTAEKAASDALKTSEFRLEQAIVASEIGLWDWTVSDGTLWWSQRFKDIIGVDDTTFGGSLEDFTGRLHPEDHDRIMAALEDHLGKKTPYDVRYRLRHEDGHYVWIEARGQAVWDEADEVTRMIGTVADITERNAGELALRQQNGQMELAAQLSGVGYWRIDLLEDTMFWSDQIYAIHDVTPETYTPELTSALDFYHHEDLPAVQQHVSAAIDEGSAFEFEARLIRPDGEIRNVKSIAQVEQNEAGKSVSLFGVFQDVTDDRKREAKLRSLLDALSRSNEELNRFSYVCSHDMKEPVRLIESMCALILDKDVEWDPTERDDLIERIGTNTRRLSEIIDSLLAYSRVDQKIEETEIDLNAVIHNIRESLALSIAESNAEITVGDLPTVWGSRVHFLQLFQNLITNAIKFARQSPVKIEISGGAENGHFVFQVEDNGPGIPPESREDVFTVFKRLQRRDEVDGSGLGLSICQRIVTQYGGSISVGESETLGGAKFVFSIPREERG